ncbi:MAG: Cof-type HAD-IIB family hydrolase [Syntrophomonadaceae bacterium]|jgi:Cof subfamily protein (haloacid dehalogenase superfamily)|nr:Cof-type HAD-IIB family hydrolase [Syntrophomonadaceae bacterium]MDH7497655.1 Cof-type HAD-IIB family hydrolase [Syntrophomonadaceae bacterium]
MSTAPAIGRHAQGWAGPAPCIPGERRIKLVAIDLDDTLLDSRLRIPPAAAEAIARARRRGVHITLATGRMFASALPYALQLGVDLPLISYQGALVRHVLSGEELVSRKVDPGAGRQALARLREWGLHVQAYWDDRLCMEALTPEGEDYARLAGVTPLLVERLEDVVEGGTFKLLAVSYQVERLAALEARLQREFASRLYVTRSKPHFLELMHPEATKGRALAAVAAHLGVERAQVMAIGDSYNDIDMLRWAGVGVAVANAPEAVRRAADLVTLSNDDGGVAHAIVSLVLGEGKENADGGTGVLD